MTAVSSLLPEPQCGQISIHPPLKSHGRVLYIIRRDSGATDCCQVFPCDVSSDRFFSRPSISSDRSTCPPCVDCIDFERSDIQFYPDDHPEKAGKPRGVKKLRISGASVGSCHIFRPRDWTVVEIVSEKVKQALEGNGIKGIEYWPVTE